MTAEATTKSILVVDDEDTIREVIRRYLERDGFAVREAADGYAALEAIQDGPPDLIVLDLMLPGVDGLSITQQIRERHRIPIIMLTAKGETSDRIRGLDLGADDYMAKPFSPQELVSRVKAVLRRAGGGASPRGAPEHQGAARDRPPLTAAGPRRGPGLPRPRSRPARASTGCGSSSRRSCRSSSTRRRGVGRGLQ